MENPIKSRFLLKSPGQTNHLSLNNSHHLEDKQKIWKTVESLQQTRVKLMNNKVAGEKKINQTHYK